jgi:hypothetical protein
MRATKLRLFVLLLVILGSITIETGQAKPKEKKKLPNGTPVLWRQPTDISERNLYLGPGGTEMRPDLRSLTLIKEEKGGYSKKYRVKDASGREWVAKIGKEAQSETSAVRLLWGVGYETEINYLVPEVQIPGKGTFQNVRFEARPDDVKRVANWKWDKNPFVRTREFQGLKVMMVLLSNWDIKDSNNEILYSPDTSGDELRYIISDMGATFGHASGTFFFWRITRSRNNPDKYAKSEFLEKVKGNKVYLHDGGKRKDLFRDISVDDAVWMGTLLSQLSDDQLKDAFRAANYTPAQINLLTSAVKRRTNQLMSLRPQQRFGRTSD